MTEALLINMDPEGAMDGLLQAAVEAAELDRERVPPTRGPLQVPLFFALIAHRPGAHDELLTLLQANIVAPLIARDILIEFRVLAATPPSFIAEASTMLVFELVVPCPWPVTDHDVRMWQHSIGDDVRLIVAPAPVPRRTDTWDAQRARMVLARAMLLLPKVEQVHPDSHPAGGSSWLVSCMDRMSMVDDSSPVSPPSRELRPWLTAIDEVSGLRVRLSEGRTLLTSKMAQQLFQHLPVSLRWRRAWRLVYSPRVHGISLQTFYRRMQKEGPTILLVQDHLGRAFGGFAPSQWHVSDRYYGTGESFVFRFRRRLPRPVLPLMHQAELLEEAQSPSVAEPASAANAVPPGDRRTTRLIQRAVKTLQEWNPKARAAAERGKRQALAAGSITSPTEALDELLGLTPPVQAASQQEPGAAEGAPEEDPFDEDLLDEDDPGLEVFHWSSKDLYFLFSDAECIAMGGGSAFALYIEKDLLHGMSEPCSTYASQMLSCTQNFIIGDLEIWAFDDPTQQEADD